VDPYAASQQDCFGSYLVFRKLEQNVRGFKHREEQLARWLGLKGSAVQKAGALIMGRFTDGTPLTSSAVNGMNEGVPNNFNYAEDTDGTRCPFSAHIRKVNPRGDSASPGRARDLGQECATPGPGEAAADRSPRHPLW
jgi:deferrochelatase/peroxidase EfeB